MAIRFQRAPLVQPGLPITSTQALKFARAWNTRLPYFNLAWRIAFYVAGLFRQMRNPDASGNLWEANLGFFYYYQMLDRAQGDWPIADAGDPEGLNLNNPLCRYVAGGGETALPLEIGGDIPTTAWGRWLLGKIQRGGADLATGASETPAWTSARDWSLLYYGRMSPFVNGYGGWMASPDLAVDDGGNYIACDDPNTADGVPAPVNRIVRFTATEAGVEAGFSDMVFGGTCQWGDSLDDVSKYDEHVFNWWSTPWAHTVVLNKYARTGEPSGLIVLPRWAYTEGPYNGPCSLRKMEGWQLPRALATFTSGHCGVLQNARKAGFQPWDGWLEGCVAAEAFLASQYVLAPARAITVGGVPVAQYPSATLTANSSNIIPAQTVLTARVHRYHVITHAVAAITNPVKDVTLQAYIGRDLVGTITLTTDETSATLQLPRPATFDEVVTVKLAADALCLDASDQMIVELAELVEYKPDIHDLQLICRTYGSPAEGKEVNADEWVAQLNSRACAQNSFGASSIEQPTAGITASAIYQAAREWSKRVRFANRFQLVGYECNKGRSTLIYRRHAYWTGGEPQKEEVFEGYESILAGHHYLVESSTGGSVTYRARAYTNGQEFIGVTDGDDFTTSGTVTLWHILRGYLTPTSGADLFAGIAGEVRSVAPEGGTTNRWLIDFEFLPYNTSDSSIWKPSAYSDWFGFNYRGTFFSGDINRDSALKWHFSFGQSITGYYGGNMVSEMPSWYAYCSRSFGGNLNTFDAGTNGLIDEADRTNFYKSCRIGEQSLEIESATTEWDGRTELVKLVLKGRLHTTNGNTDGADDSIARGTVNSVPASWTIAKLEAEPFASVENCITRYIYHRATGYNFQTPKRGDQAIDSEAPNLTDAPWATIYPNTYLVQMLPEPFDDGNDDPNEVDSKFLAELCQQAELYTRATCEAFVDVKGSRDKYAESIRAYVEAFGTWPTNAQSLGVHDFRFDDLMTQARGAAWATALPTVETPWNDAFRADAPHGFGPMPGVRGSAETFNQLSSAVNLLTTLRVMLPWTVESKRTTYTGSEEITGVHGSCGTATIRASKDDVNPISAETYDAGNSDADWVLEGSMSASAQLGIEGLTCPWKKVVYRTDLNWRVVFTFGVEAALPPYVAALWNPAQLHFWGVFTRTVQNVRRANFATAEEGAPYGENPGWWFPSPEGGYSNWNYGEAYYIGPAPEGVADGWWWDASAGVFRQIAQGKKTTTIQWIEPVESGTLIAPDLPNTDTAQGYRTLEGEIVGYGASTRLDVEPLAGNTLTVTVQLTPD
jgi:hypothetical protein